MNNIPASYRRRDGLKTLSQSKKKTYSGQELDLNYRGALEIAREGELEITVPSLEQSKTVLPKPIPKSSPRDVIDRFDKLLRAHHSLAVDEKSVDNSLYDMPSEPATIESERSMYLLQVKIKYALVMTNQHCEALVFRRPPPLVKLMQSKRPDGKDKDSTPTVCAYTGDFSANSVRNVDGIRCWLPTLDRLDQRFVFDITISLLKSFHVVCVGKRLSVSKSSRSGRNSVRKLHRFFTPNRIPVSQLGFFIGKVETYKMPLYKVKARIWVATGLADYLSRVGESQDRSEHSNNEPSSSSLHPAVVGAEPVLKKRTGSDLDSFKEDSSSKKVTKVNRHGDIASERQNKSSLQSAVPGYARLARRLYGDMVHHTFLGLNLALRLLHKFTGHKYDYDEFTYIFVQDLGRDFLAFDSFALIDLKFLHAGDKIYMETPAHLTLIEAYLQAWLRSAIPVAAFEFEFLLQGTIGYLVNFYVEEVYGDDEGQYYYQKRLDTVLGVEKQGRAQALVGFYPERYETFTLVHSEYLAAKAAVLFHLIEQAVGGKDPMRVALKHIIKSPLLFTQSVFKGLSEQDLAVMSSTSSPNQLPSDSPQMSLSRSDSGGETPQTSFTPYAGYQSPYSYTGMTGNMSPYLPYGIGRPMYQGAMTPYTVAGMTPAHDQSHGQVQRQGLGSLSPPRLQRQASVGSDIDGEKDLALMATDCLTPESFLVIIRHASEASTEIDDSLLERYVYSAGALFLRVHVGVSERIENKPRTITVNTDQVGYKTGGLLGKRYCKQGEISMLMVEDRDDNVTEPVLLYSDRSEVHKQQAYARPGRRGGKRRKARDTSQLTEEKLLALATVEREKEARKSALQLARDMEFPVRYVILDPSFRHIAEVQNTSCDVLLVEQLNADYDKLGGMLDKHKLLLQCQALRSLARSKTSAISNAILPPPTASKEGQGPASAAINPPGSCGSLAEKSARMQLKACADCILGITGSGFEANPPEPTTSVYVRAEAAFALANWQNEYAPYSIASEDVTRHWPGMELLLDCLLELYVDTNKQEPLVQDYHNEGSVYLRNCLLLALSSIRSQNGYTPLEVIESCLLFAEHLDHESESLVDCSYHIAVLFAALSRLRYRGIDVHKLSQPVHKVVQIVSAFIQDSYTTARTVAHIQHQANDANFLPALVAEGLAVAAGLSCLAEIDLQGIAAFASGQGNGGSKVTLLELEAPTSRGIVSDMRYVDYFIAPGSKLKCIFEDSDNSSAQKHRQEMVYHMSPPLVRLAAFEAFVRICFALHLAKQERLKVQVIKAASTGTAAKSSIANCWFVAAAVEALQHVLEHDRSVYVTQEAAYIFFDTVLDRPGRIIYAGLSNGSVLGSMGWSDKRAFTFLHRPKVAEESASSNGPKKFASQGAPKMAMKGGGKSMKIALESLLRSITKTFAYNQVIRTGLLQTWLYVFKGQVPEACWLGDQPPPSVQEADRLLQPLDPGRLVIRNPTEVFNAFEQSMKHGALYNQPATPRGSNMASSSSASPGPVGSSSMQRIGSTHMSSQPTLKLTHSMNSMASQLAQIQQASQGQQGQMSGNSSSGASGNVVAGEKKPSFKLVLK